MIGILGGGFAGLMLGSLLGDKAEVLEASDTPGGLCKTLTVNGFSFDIGGHVLFSKDKEALQVELDALGDNVALLPRTNRVLYKGKIVNWPLENALHELEPWERVEAGESLLGMREIRSRNFGDWLESTFGDWLYENYLRPYNDKLWKTPLEEMSTQWVGRVPQPTTADILRGVAGLPSEGYKHQLEMYYPRKGGFGALTDALAKRCVNEITNESTLRPGRPIKKLKRLESGQWDVYTQTPDDWSQLVFRYDRLISTLPITTLFECLGDVPEHVQEAARGLRFNPITVVLVAVKGELPEYTAIYVPHKESPYHRLTFPKAFSKEHCPEGWSSVACEVTGPNDPELQWKVHASLVRDGIVKREGDILVSHVHTEPYGYPVYTHSYQERMQVIREYTESRGIILLGRWGEHSYWNTDTVTRRCIDLAKEFG